MYMCACVSVCRTPRRFFYTLNTPILLSWRRSRYLKNRRNEADWLLTPGGSMTIFGNAQRIRG